MNEKLRILQRQPKRITITLSHHVHEALLTRSEEEGRSVSNPCAYLLENSLCNPARLAATDAAAYQEFLGMPAPKPMDKKIKGNGHFRGN